MNVYEAIAARRTIRDFAERPVAMPVVEKIIEAGLKAPTNNHLRQWEFVVVDGKEEIAKVLRVTNMTDKDECEAMLDGFGMTDTVQRDMYRVRHAEAVFHALQRRMPDTSLLEGQRTVAQAKFFEFAQRFCFHLVLH